MEFGKIYRVVRRLVSVILFFRLEVGVLVLGLVCGMSEVFGVRVVLGSRIGFFFSFEGVDLVEMF